jgi:vacuolar-type H+-ATPase subunit I/STV1
MKKNFFSMAVLAIVISLASCKSSSSWDKDVRKKADYMCKVQQLTAKAGTDEAAAKDLEKVKKEMDDFDAEMEKKYKEKEPTAEQSASAEKIMKEVMEKCK